MIKGLLLHANETGNLLATLCFGTILVGKIVILKAPFVPNDLHSLVYDFFYDTKMYIPVWYIYLHEWFDLYGKCR